MVCIPWSFQADLLPTTGNLPGYLKVQFQFLGWRNSKGESKFTGNHHGSGSIWNHFWCSRSGIVQPTRYYHRYQTIWSSRRIVYRPAQEQVVYSHLTILLSVYLVTTLPQEQFKSSGVADTDRTRAFVVLVRSGNLLVLQNLLLSIQKRDRCSSPYWRTQRSIHCKSTRRRNRDQTFWNYRTRNSHICRATIRYNSYCNLELLVYSLCSILLVLVHSESFLVQQNLHCQSRRETNALLLYWRNYKREAPENYVGIQKAIRIRRGALSDFETFDWQPSWVSRGGLDVTGTDVKISLFLTMLDLVISLLSVDLLNLLPSTQTRDKCSSRLLEQEN